MNMYFLDADPVAAARYHCNAHVSKMPTETAQLLSAVHWRTGYRGPNHVEHGNGPYKDSRSAKPTLGPLRWILQSLANYRWAVGFGFALAAEYTRRYGKAHGVVPVLEWLKAHEPDIPDVGQTPFITSDMGQYLVAGDPIESQRRFYVGEKGRFAKWPAGETPEWFVQGIAAADARA